MSEMNSYELSRSFFDWCYENPDMVSPNLVALYFFIIEHCNRLGWKDKFGLPTQMCMDAIGIKNWRTYSKAFNDLVDFEFIKVVEKSKNQYSATVIAIVKNTKANTKALSKATQKHLQKHSSSIAVIDKPINQEPINQLTEIEENFNELETYEKWKANVMKGHSLSNDQFKKLFNAFKTQCLISCEEKTIGGLQGYFARWIPIHKEKVLKTVTNSEIKY